MLSVLVSTSLKLKKIVLMLVGHWQPQTCTLSKPTKQRIAVMGFGQRRQKGQEFSLSPLSLSSVYISSLLQCQMRWINMEPRYFSESVYPELF